MKKNIMKNKISLIVSGIELNLLSEESEEYMKKLSHMIDRRIGDIVMNNARCSKMEAALFCCLDYLDTKIKTDLELATTRDRADRFQKEFSFLKQENDELKRLLGGDITSDESESAVIDSETEENNSSESNSSESNSAVSNSAKSDE